MQLATGRPSARDHALSGARRGRRRCTGSVVGAGAAVEIGETAGTLAHPVPSGEPPIEQRIVLGVGTGGTLIWHAANHWCWPRQLA
jgi:hypothetical protein